MNKRIITLAVVMLLIAGEATANKKIVFYEIGTPKQYTIRTGLSQFAGILTSRGYEIASITRGELRADTLDPYDILIIYPAKTLTIEEISAILGFVTTKGKGLMIIGGKPSHTNQLMIPFGMTMDEGTLIDSTDSMPNRSNTDFIVDKFGTSDQIRVIRQGVTKIGFYTGHGLFISGKVNVVARGDYDTYSDTLSFPSGSQPTICASTLFGAGLVVGLSDPDMLTNKYIGQYNNARFAENLVDWLGLAPPPMHGNLTFEEIQILMEELKLEKLRLQYERDELFKQKTALEKQNAELTARVFQMSDELNELKKGKIGPFTRNNWAMMIPGVCILVASLVVSKRKKKPKVQAEDVLGELGYEFDEEPKKKEGSGEAEEELSVDDLDEDVGEL